MERNKDPDVIIMDRRVYDTLLHYANIGISEAGGDIDSELCHIRKFNPVVSAEHRKAIEDDRAKKKKACWDAKTLLSTHCGEEVYLRHDSTLIAPVTLKGLGKDGHPWLTIIQTYPRRLETQTHVSQLMAEVPEGYRLHRVGKYEGCYIHNDRQVGD